MNKTKPVMSVLALTMINVIAIDSLRSIPMSATYGFSLLFYYIICALLFFIPSALVSAELTTGWPQNGGIYVWVREAFGKPAAFTVIFIQWIYNICWYPTILSLLAATLAYVINPTLASNTWYMLAIVFVTYWLITIVTLRGMHISSMLSTATAIIGTLIPMAFITILGIIWLLQGKPINMDISFKAFLPDLKPGNLVLLTGVLYSLVGMEMSAQMPFAILITQGIVFSIICLVFLVMPTVNSSFWILSNLTSQLALSCYIFIFAAAIRLRYKFPEVKRSYRIPFGNFGMWIVGLAGILASVFTVLIGFVPPSQIDVGNLKFYEIFLIVGFVGFYLISLLIYKMQKCFIAKLPSA